MKKHLSYFILYIFLEACSPGKGENANSSPKTSKIEPPVSVQALVAEPLDYADALEVNGTLQAQESVELRSEISGRLIYVNISEGSVVGQGTIIARLNSDDLQAQAKKYQAQLVLASKNEERLKKLLEVGGLNQQDYDAALSQVQILQADIAFVQAQIQKTIIRTSFTGRLGLRQVSVGAYVSPSNVLTTLQNNSLQVDFNVPEEYIEKISIGKKVKIKAQNRDLEGSIIASESQISASTRNLKVRARVNNPDNISRAGMFVKVYLGEEDKQKAFFVPSNAIIPETRGKKIILIKHGKAVFVEVSTGIRRESKVQIVRGLQAGDTVAVTGLLFVKPNSSVKISKIIQ